MSDMEKSFYKSWVYILGEVEKDYFVPGMQIKLGEKTSEGKLNTQHYRHESTKCCCFVDTTC